MGRVGFGICCACACNTQQWLRCLKVSPVRSVVWSEFVELSLVWCGMKFVMHVPVIYTVELKGGGGY